MDTLYAVILADLTVAKKTYVDVHDYSDKEKRETRSLVEKNPKMHLKDLGNVWVVTRRCVPKLTGRELIQMGYNPAENDLFRRIMWDLSDAISRGEVQEDVLDSQILWVKEHWEK